MSSKKIGRREAMAIMGAAERRRRVRVRRFTHQPDHLVRVVVHDQHQCRVQRDADRNRRGRIRR